MIKVLSQVCLIWMIVLIIITLPLSFPLWILYGEGKFLNEAEKKERVNE